MWMLGGGRRCLGGGRGSCEMLFGVYVGCCCSIESAKKSQHSLRCSKNSPRKRWNLMHICRVLKSLSELNLTLH